MRLFGGKAFPGGTTKFFVSSFDSVHPAGVPCGNDVTKRLRISYIAFLKARFVQVIFKGRAITIMLLLLAVVVLIGRAVVAGKSDSKRKPVLYHGKSIETLFYSSRTNFPNREEMHVALLYLGTNAFPFLLANLKERRGDGVLYFKTYRALPAWIQRKLRYPILRDDIKTCSWDYLGWVHDLTEEQIEELCGCVPKMENPRVRISALNSIAGLYGTYPAYFALCRKLLDDPNPAIRLKAAIRLAQRPKRFQEQQARLFPILIEGLKIKERRRLLNEISYYNFGKIPPGGTGMIVTNSGGSILTSDEYLRNDLINALRGLKAETSEQSELQKQILSTEPAQSRSPYQ